MPTHAEVLTYGAAQEQLFQRLEGVMDDLAELAHWANHDLDIEDWTPQQDADWNRAIQTIYAVNQILSVI